jgi:hypothetical protein
VFFFAMGADGAVKVDRPGAFSRPVLFSALADQLAYAVVASCDEHETNNGEPGDHEGNGDHGVDLSVFGPCSGELRPFRGRS